MKQLAAILSFLLLGLGSFPVTGQAMDLRAFIALTHDKLKAIEAQIQELDVLRRELLLLVTLCRGADDGCPIIDDMET